MFLENDRQRKHALHVGDKVKVRGQVRTIEEVSDKTVLLDRPVRQMRQWNIEDVMPIAETASPFRLG